MWELDRKEGWVPKNWCFWTMVLEKTLESPMDCKEIKPANPEGHQPWIFMGRTDTEAPIRWPPDAKSQLIRKDPDAGKDWRLEEKDDRGQDGWMASPTQWAWVWASSGRWWWTGRPAVLQSMGLQRVGHDRATEQQSPETTLPQNFTMKLPISQFGSRELSPYLCWGNNTCIVLSTSKVLVQKTSTQIASLRSISS